MHWFQNTIVELLYSPLTLWAQRRASERGGGRPRTYVADRQNRLSKAADPPVCFAIAAYIMEEDDEFDVVGNAPECWGAILKGEDGSNCDSSFRRGRRHMCALARSTPFNAVLHDSLVFCWGQMLVMRDSSHSLVSSAEHAHPRNPTQTLLPRLSSSCAHLAFPSELIVPSVCFLVYPACVGRCYSSAGRINSATYAVARAARSACQRLECVACQRVCMTS